MIREYRKYKNRRIYETLLKRYATFADIAAALYDGDIVRIFFRKDGMDIDVTREVLLEVLISVEAKRVNPVLTVETLHQMLSIRRELK